MQKGKFAACALRVRVTALKRVDLPTLGNPTIPALSIGGRTYSPHERGGRTKIADFIRNNASTGLGGGNQSKTHDEVF